MAAITTFNFGDITFDLTVAPAGVNHGYTKANRDGLADDILIKVRNLATKTNLDAKLTKGLQVATYNPSDMKDGNNFFVFVLQWESIILQMETRLKTYYMESPFLVFQKFETRANADEQRLYEAQLGTFLIGNAQFHGDGQVYTDDTDPLNHIIVNRPVEPPTTITIVDTNRNVLRDWHSLTMEQVVESVSLQLAHIGDAVHRQNLPWSFHYLMDCLDHDLKQFVLSKLARYPTDVARSGPVVFMIVAQRILQTTENLAQKVINGFIALRLTHFDGESVVEAIFTLRNVLKFLRYGEANTFAPRTTLVLLYDVFRGTSVAAFRSHVQQAQDIVLSGETDPEVIFDHLQSKYDELVLADRWVPTKKRQSVFVAGTPETKTYAEAADKGKDAKVEEKKKTPGGKKRPTHDKKGNAIDYTPPKKGEPHSREKDGRTEYWCKTCKRWGNHKSDGHDEWAKGWKDLMAKRKEEKKTAAAATTPSVTFVSGLSQGSPSLTMDSELTDGIDL